MSKYERVRFGNVRIVGKVMAVDFVDMRGAEVRRFMDGVSVDLTMMHCDPAQSVYVTHRYSVRKVRVRYDDDRNQWVFESQRFDDTTGESGWDEVARVDDGEE